MIALQFDDSGVRVDLQQARALPGVILQKWLADTLQHLHQAVERNIGAGGLIGRRTGNLARALRELVTVTPDGIVGELWPDPDKVAYGGIQEEGGAIVPRRGRALAIPLDAMLTGNGVARATAGQVRADPSAFGFQSTFIPKGHAVIMGRTSGRSSPIPLFALVSQVTLPARRYLATTLIQEWAWIADRLEQVTQETVTVAFALGAS